MCPQMLRQYSAELGAGGIGQDTWLTWVHALDQRPQDIQTVLAAELAKNSSIVIIEWQADCKIGARHSSN